MNLMNMAMKYVGPMVAQQIATRLGIGGPIANKLIAAALPTVMGAIIGKSKSGAGLGAIMGLLTGSDRPKANALADMFDGGGDVDALVSSGGGMLEGLLGGQSMGVMSKALGQYAGVDADKASGLLGMLAPAALGTLGDQVADQGLDQAGLGKFLTSQAGNVASAMPGDFAKQLQGTGLLDGLGASMAQSEEVAKAAKKGSKLPLLIGVVAIAAAGWYFLGGSNAPDTAALQDFTVGDVDLGGQFNTVTTGLTEAFTGITDQASAEAALPQLRDLTGQLGSLSETAGQLTGAAQTGFQGIVATALSAIRPVIEGAIANSGAGGILQPIADQIFAALEGMAG